MKAKETSHIGMIIGAIGLVVVFVVAMIKFITSSYVPTITQCLGLILMGISPSIPFCPVFISTWLDKIVEMKQGIKKDDTEIETQEEN